MSKIYEEEYRMIGGIEQYILHYPVQDAPVLLLLHGGPGSAESNFSYLFHDWWKGQVTIVQYDQRGSGKTLRQNPDISRYPITRDAMLDDLEEIVQYLKRKYNQEKIILLGHSWGTVLGALYAHRRPQDVSLYIGVAQVVNMIENEQAGYQKVRELAVAAGNQKDVRKLDQVGNYPPERIDGEGYKKVAAVRGLQQKYGLAVGLTWPLIQMFRKSPVYRFSDLTTMMFKASKANMPLFNGLMAFDLKQHVSHYEMPVCCIQGERDYQSVTSLATAYYEQVQAPAKQIHVIKDAGHNTMIDQPERFAAALAEALTMIM